MDRGPARSVATTVRKVEPVKAHDQVLHFPHTVNSNLTPSLQNRLSRKMITQRQLLRILVLEEQFLALEEQLAEAREQLLHDIAQGKATESGLHYAVLDDGELTVF